MSSPPALMKPLSSVEESFLRALSQALTCLPRAFNADLEREQRMSMSEYLVLMHLSESPNHLMRMGELANAAALSVSGMTRVVKRLEERDLVERVQADDDGRSWFAVLTAVGRKRLGEAWPTHLSSVRRHLFDHLDGVDLAATTTALESVAASARTASVSSR